ncbi:DUF1995 domain containing protein [Nitzschia inconspicua]|uniref:DUF1995 domain containing protein n=1 Tax=Nitzschia inconspicua TaxID=303405 RepID=A0A9K3LXL1_9STRA|nr:DUF1995 domain containing protein [Nitzschia inconspicua]
MVSFFITNRAFLLSTVLVLSGVVDCFTSTHGSQDVRLTSAQTYSPVIKTELRVFGGGNNNSNTLTSLPKGISPFEKSKRDVPKELRTLAQAALLQGLNDRKTRLEIEFPPLLGGDNAKSQFDDFDNVQELNKNRDWCIELLPSLKSSLETNKDNIWLVLPDLKEVELAKNEWTGKRYQDAGSFTSIEAVTKHYASDDAQQEYSKPWGATFASFANQLMNGGGGDDPSESGGGGLLGDARALDPLQGTCNLHLVCQPGNGGPVEDWINVKAFHDAAGDGVPTCIVNGALDKVRDGYYAAFIFPKLAKTFDFYKSFEPMLFLKPISDKGVYGWTFRVYPEPWQVVLQTPVRDAKDQLIIEETVALVSSSRPTYQEALQSLLATAAKR